MTSKVLIADDEAYIRLLIEQTLENFEDQGVEMLFAENGEKALQLIQEEKPELVFLDVMMPKMSGYDVCTAVRQELKLEQVFIILLTAKGQEVDRQQGMQAGANHYMTKPFNPDELIAITTRVLAL